MDYRVVCQVGVSDEAEEEEAVVFSTHGILWMHLLYIKGRGLYFLSCLCFEGMSFWQNKTMNFVAFYKMGGGRRKRKTYFECMYNKRSNPIILEFGRNQNLGWLSKYAFEQVFSNLTQENGNCYTSCHFGPSQQHCICCIPWNCFFLKRRTSV